MAIHGPGPGLRTPAMGHRRGMWRVGARGSRCSITPRGADADSDGRQSHPSEADQPGRRPSIIPGRAGLGCGTGSGWFICGKRSSSTSARVTSPKVLTGTGELAAITVVSAKDAWAVGSTGSTHPRTLILHWNGVAWSAVTRPAPVANGNLEAVTANAKGGWAVGSHSTGPAVIDT